MFDGSAGVFYVLSQLQSGLSVSWRALWIGYAITTAVIGCITIPLLPKKENYGDIDADYDNNNDNDDNYGGNEYNNNDSSSSGSVRHASLSRNSLSDNSPSSPSRPPLD
jgi:hypothetical protein